MLKKSIQRFAFGRTTWDQTPYWARRATEPDTTSVMWPNRTLNELVDRDQWRIIERHLPESRGTVLDLGCGTGRMSTRLAARFDAYTGVDLAPMVEEAARRHPRLADRYVASTVDAWTYPTSAFDLALSIACLVHACSADRLGEAASSIAGSIRPNGRLILIEPFHTNRLLTRGCRTTGREATALFEAAGLRVLASTSMMFFPNRIALGDGPFGRFPGFTRVAYELGERVVRGGATFLSDYSVIVLQKPRSDGDRPDRSGAARG